MKMYWNYRIVFLLAALFCLSAAITASQAEPGDVWTRIDMSQLRQPGILADAIPSSYETFRLDRAALQSILAQAPEEFTAGREVILTLPMPDGTMQRFSIEHSLVVERGLLDDYPELGSTYRGQGIDDPTATVRFDLLPDGFHSMILSSTGTVIVDPFSPETTENYISYYKRDRPRIGGFECLVGSEAGFEEIMNLKDPGDHGFFQNIPGQEVISGTQLRTYRLALASNFEYCAAVGGNTVAGCLNAQVVVMNRVNGVYERDVAIHMNIIGNNNLIVFAGNNLTCGTGQNQACTANNDPYTNADGVAMLGQNQTTLDARIGSANYDIGHVFSTGGGGVANLAVPCTGGKARGVTGLPNPIGDPFAIDYVSHEMGHQWGANHTFNATSDNCNGNRSAGSAYEVGSGITIMAYSGICAPQNLANFSIDTFHVKSLEVITAYSQTGNGNTCAAITASGNTPPSVTGPGNFNIPKRTPFSLSATATDPNGDPLTYDWQEYDLGAPATTVPNSDEDGIVRPIFRPFLPTATGTRTFPRLTHILNSANVPPNTTGGFMTGERLPSITRVMTFQVVVRDNRANAGGVSSATSLISIDGNSGPFAVTSPNTPVTYGINSLQTITWDVANTTAAPVNAANVRITMSTDGGNSFPIVLSASSPNDGSENVTMPGTLTTTARVKIEAVGNIFFDISNTNFTLIASPTTFQASSFLVLQGRSVVGGLAELAASDNTYLSILQNPFRARTTPAVQVQFEAVTQISGASSIDFRVEANTSAVPAGEVRQRIELFNFATGQWTTVAETAAAGSDFVQTGTVSSSASEYLEVGTGRVRSRVSWFDPETLVTRAWRVNIDHVSFTINP